jgi:mannose-6-phosphate isomerase-like protein (cupin superfamily)
VAAIGRYFLNFRKETKKNMIWSADIENDTINNKLWRKVVETGKHLQVVLMSVPPEQELGWERHGRPKPTDQFFRVDSPQGHGVLQVGRKMGQVDDEIDLHDGIAAVVPGGMWHNVINDSRHHRLNFYTVYAPPHHPRDRVDRTKSDELRRERRRKKSRASKKTKQSNRR